MKLENWNFKDLSKSLQVIYRQGPPIDRPLGYSPTVYCSRRVCIFHQKMHFYFFFWLKRVPDRDPEQRKTNLTVLCLLIIIILISYIIIYYIIIKLLTMENHPSRNQKRNSLLLYFELMHLALCFFIWHFEPDFQRKIIFWKTPQFCILPWIWETSKYSDICHSNPGNEATKLSTAVISSAP